MPTRKRKSKIKAQYSYVKIYACDNETSCSYFSKLMWLMIQENLYDKREAIIARAVTCPEEINLPNELGWTPLHIACRNMFELNLFWMVKFLLDNGANVDQTNKNGDTALMMILKTIQYDCTRDRIDVIKLLLGAGADINKTNNNGWTPLFFAINYLKSNNTEENDSAEIIKLLLDGGANVNHLDGSNKTALMLATKYCSGHTKVIELLLGAGANVNITNDEHCDCLMLAIKYANVQTIKLILAAGANVNTLNNNGWSSLMFATKYVKSENTEVIKLLLSAGANVNNISNHAWTALALATKYSGTISNLDTVDTLLNAGADVNIMNVYGQTPLILAAKFYRQTSRLETIKLLLLHAKIDVTIIDNKGKTYLDYLREPVKEQMQYFYHQIQKTRKLYDSVKKFIVSNGQELLHRPSSIRIKCLSCKWQLDKYHILSQKYSTLMEYFSVTDEDSFRQKILDVTKFMD